MSVDKQPAAVRVYQLEISLRDISPMIWRRLLVTKGCVNCHAVEASGKALEAMAKFPTLDETRKADNKGCLSQPAHLGSQSQ